MTTPGGGAACRDAESYYFALLENDAAVPEAIRHHVVDCPFCRRQIGHLRRLVSEAEGDSGSPRHPVNGAVEALGRQFAWLDERVTCSGVKPFLPELLMPSREIRIPTPITVHVDHCPRCAADLAALRRQDLTGDQLQRLSRLYRHASGGSPTTCRRARPAVASLATLSLKNVDPEALNHVSTCAKCRDRAYRGRESQAENGSRAEPGHDQALQCDDVRATDLFDWVVPCGLETPGGEAADVSREVLAAHVRSCPQCMQKLQSLHRIVYGIAERADSSVCTVYHARRDAEEVRDRGRNVCDRYPIDVQVFHCEPAGASSAGPVATARAVTLPRKPLMKVALTAVAAAVLLTSYFAISPTASGTNVRELLRALEGAANVHVTTLARETRDPVQEMWVARDLNLLMIGAGGRHVLYEFDRRHKRTVRHGTPDGAPVKLGKREYENGRRLMTDCVRAVLPNVPGGAEVHQTADEPFMAEGRPVVYETAWTTRTGEGSPLHHRLRVLIDPRTDLPQRMEFFQKRASGDGWELRTTKTFEYLAEPAMADAIRALFPSE